MNLSFTRNLLFCLKKDKILQYSSRVTNKSFLKDFAHLFFILSVQEMLRRYFISLVRQTNRNATFTGVYKTQKILLCSNYLPVEKNYFMFSFCIPCYGE